MDVIFSLLISISVMGIAWFLFQQYQWPAAAEVFRPIAIFMTGGFYLVFAGWDEKSGSAFYVLGLWTLRLAGFMIYSRFITAGPDGRYQYLCQSWQDKDQRFLFYFIQQGLYVWVVSLPFLFIGKDPTYSLCDQLLLIFTTAMIIGAAIADWQLYSAQKSAPNEVCQTGLWAYMRHPNYFFEWLTWVGFSLTGVYNLTSLVSLFACILLFFVFRFNRIKITEDYLLSVHPIAYKAYQSRVPAFFPW